MKQHILIAILLIAISGFCENVETVKVHGKGIGVTKIEALKDAYRDAVERAVGLYVDAEQMVKNEDLVKDQILTQSNAYIANYKIAKETTSTDGLVSVTIIADVCKRDLTKKIRDVIPAKTIDLSDVSKNLHAQIVTDFKASDDAVSIIKNELKDLQPLKQLMSVTLGTTKPVVESVKEDSSLVRLWYPIKVEVDVNKYYKEFAPRWSRILEQIKIGSARHLELKNSSKYVKAYKDIVAEKFGTTRKGRAGIMTRCEEDYRQGWPYAGVLEKCGLALNQEYQGIAFFDTRILGKGYALHGLNEAPFSHGYFAGYALRDKPDEFGIGLIERAYINSDNNCGLLKQIDSSCNFRVALVTKASGQTLTGNLYNIPQPCTEDILQWQHQTACGTTDGDKYRETAPEIEFNIRFLDVKTCEIASQTFSLRNHELINIVCVRLEEPRNCDGDYVGGTRLWMITPLVGGFAKSYVKWISIDIPKDDVAKITTASISVEE